MVVSQSTSATANTQIQTNTNADACNGNGETHSAGSGEQAAVGAQLLPDDAPGGDGSTSNERIRRNRTRADDNEHKTALQIASLNINGFGNLIRDHDNNKWGRIYRMMSEHRIGALLHRHFSYGRETAEDDRRHGWHSHLTPRHRSGATQGKTRIHTGWRPSGEVQPIATYVCLLLTST